MREKRGFQHRPSGAGPQHHTEMDTRAPMTNETGSNQSGGETRRAQTERLERHDGTRENGEATEGSREPDQQEQREARHGKRNDGERNTGQGTDIGGGAKPEASPQTLRGEHTEGYNEEASNDARGTRKEESPDKARKDAAKTTQ